VVILFVALILVFPLPVLAVDAPLRLLHTRHYEIHTDMEDPLLADLATRLDAMFDQYTKTFADFKPPANAPALPVYLFDKHDRYMAFTDFTAVNTGGIFRSGRKTYLAAYEQGQGRDALRRTLQHEAFHQFAHSTISRNLPPWMNEGMAQTFEESIWTGRDFLADQVPPRRVRQLNVDITQHRLVDFDVFLAMSGKDWATTRCNISPIFRSTYTRRRSCFLNRMRPPRCRISCVSPRWILIAISRIFMRMGTKWITR
jgi:hypothetical protein